MKKKGSFVKRAGNAAVFLLRNVLFVLGAILAGFLMVRLAAVLTGEEIADEWRAVLLDLSLAAALIGCSVLFGLFPFPYVCVWHDYDGCKCLICGKTRDEGHDFDGCKCLICGKTRDEGHDFDGCRCRICGKEIHDWQEISRNAHEVENVYVGTDTYGPDAYYHLETTVTFRCRRCGETRTETHESE